MGVTSTLGAALPVRHDLGFVLEYSDSCRVSWEPGLAYGGSVPAPCRPADLGRQPVGIAHRTPLRVARTRPLLASTRRMKARIPCITPKRPAGHDAPDGP